jgi:hypothetical protein
VAQDPAVSGGCGGFPRLHRRAVALGESKLTSVSVEGGRVRVLLDALVHVSQGRPGLDSGTSWEQPVALSMEQGAVEGLPAALPLWLEGGALVLGPGEGEGSALVAVPQAFAGEVVLHLLADGARLTVRGRGLSVEEHGSARFVERFAGR